MGYTFLFLCEEKAKNECPVSRALGIKIMLRSSCLGAFFLAHQGNKGITLTKKGLAKKFLPKKWSAYVTKTSNVLDLEKNVFTLRNAKQIAQSLKRSAILSKRRKGTPYQSAMSMLNFYINRAGRNISPTQKKVLEKSKEELRKLFIHTGK